MNKQHYIKAARDIEPSFGDAIENISEIDKLGNLVAKIDIEGRTGKSIEPDLQLLFGMLSPFSPIGDEMDLRTTGEFAWTHTITHDGTHFTIQLVDNTATQNLEVTLIASRESRIGELSRLMSGAMYQSIRDYVAMLEERAEEFQKFKLLAPIGHTEIDLWEVIVRGGVNEAGHIVRQASPRNYTMLERSSWDSLLRRGKGSVQFYDAITRSPLKEGVFCQCMQIPGRVKIAVMISHIKEEIVSTTVIAAPFSYDLPAAVERFASDEGK